MTLHTPLCEPLPCTLAKIPPYDSDADVYDATAHVLDPEYEHGPVVTAYFEHRETEFSAANNNPDVCVRGYWPELIAITIDHGDGLTIHSAEWALELFGGKVIARIESAQADAVNGW